MTTGQLIQKARKRSGLTQEALGGLLGVTGSALAQYETGKRKPKYETLQRIATALHVSPYELLGDEEQQLFVEREASVIAEKFKNGYKFTPDERLLVGLFHKLNNSGQDVALDRIGELTEIPKYQRQDPPQSPPEGTDTTPPEKPPESQ